MKVLITGAEGQLGRAVQATAPSSATIVAASRTRLDITDAPAVVQFLHAHRIEVVINTAAYTAVDRAESEPTAAETVNATAVATLANAAFAHAARLVHISTDFVFDGMLGRAYRPEDATAPLSVYGRTKRDGEVAALAASPDTLVLRTAWLHAPQGRNFATTMLARMRAGTPLRVVSDQIGTPTSAVHLAAAIWQLVDREAKGMLHVTDSGVASWYDFAVAVQEEALALRLIERPVPIVPIATVDYPTPARRPAFSVLDGTATRALLGEPAPHWREGVRTTLRGIAMHG